MATEPRIDADGLLAQRGLLTVNEAAAAAHVSPWTVRAWIRDGRVLVVRRGRSVLVGEDSLLEAELVLRRSPLGRPRPGTARGPKE